MQSCHGGQRELHRQEDGNDDYEHHAGAVGISLPPVSLLLTESKHRESSESERVNS